MIATIINTFTAPGETFESIVKDFNWKQAMLPLSLIMGLAIISGIKEIYQYPLFTSKDVIFQTAKIAMGADSTKYQ